MHIIDKCQWTYLRGSSKKWGGILRGSWRSKHKWKSCSSLLGKVPLKEKSCNPTYELTIFSFGRKPQQRIWDETKNKKTFGKRKYNTGHHTEISEFLEVLK